MTFFLLLDIALAQVARFASELKVVNQQAKDGRACFISAPAQDLS